MNMAEERIRLWNEWLATPEARGYDGASQDNCTRFQRTEGRLWVAERLVAALTAELAEERRRRGEAEKERDALIEAWPGDDDGIVSCWDGWYCIGSDHATQYSTKAQAVRHAAGLPAAPAGDGDAGRTGAQGEAPASRRDA